jgi:SAM-dependent methyltransferase
MATVEGEHWWFLGRGAIVRSLVESECARRGGHVHRLVDVGSGTGAVLDGFRTLADEAVGVELDPDALAICRARGLDIRTAPADRLPFPDASVDIVTAFDVLEHLHDDVAAARELRRVLQPDGSAVITVPAYPFLWSEHDIVHAHVRRYTRGSLGRTLRTAGLEIRNAGYFMTLLLPVAIVERLAERLLPRRRQLLPLPPRRLNALLLRILLAERRAVVAGGFPVGLTVFAIARPGEAR